MVATRVLHRVSPSDLVTASRLHDDAEASDGHASLGDAVWRDLEHPLDDTSAGVLATEDGRPVGFAYVYRTDNTSPPHWAAGLVLHPEHRTVDVEAALLAEVVQHVRAVGGGLVVLWVFDAHERDERAAEQTGFRPQRALYQQRVSLPLGEPVSWPPAIDVRPFVPGQDDAAWLEVNNRAFAGHPEQGAWTEETLRRRMAEPWFDPAGFLLAFDADGLAGFCWTKIHPATSVDPELGEIFVIGVDPSRKGTGLGRALVVGGLTALAERGVRTGMLFVDGDNEAALGLYAALGFTTSRVDRAYEQTV